MPTYEFRCPNGHEFEKFYRTISGAEAQAACPECGALAERILSPAGFSFKGSGFYLTDYGKNAHRDKGSAPKSTSSATSTDSGSAKSDAKSDSTKSAGESGGTSSSTASTPAPAAEAKPAPKKSTGE
ncbi:MAG TPA: zinc ribbon domain-containing protein [Gemmatimonadaceae bacterium]|nr:zinc ribbon domain-containing protein [Gemmatimonadaceae bacterium]